MTPLPFDELAGHWTPILPSAELGERPVAVTVGGVRLALFRGRDGVGGVADRCPHRGVSLALGKVVDGQLQCPFHGWRFERGGGCAHVPFNPDVPTARLGVPAVPAVERMGLVWVYLGAEAVGEPVVPELAARPGARFGFLYEDWDCHWTRVMENMLDTPHLPFVHRGTIGRGMAAALTERSRLQQEVEETPTGYSVRFRMDGERGGRLDWVRPNGMVLHLLDGPRWWARIHVWCVPTETDRTRLLVAAGYDFGWLTPLAVASAFTNRRIVFEDRAVVESSRPTRVPPASEEANVPTDKATLRFRAWYHREAGREAAAK